jgi:hypothetical protein
MVEAANPSSGHCRMTQLHIRKMFAQTWLLLENLCALVKHVHQSKTRKSAAAFLTTGTMEASIMDSHVLPQRDRSDSRVVTLASLQFGSQRINLEEH